MVYGISLPSLYFKLSVERAEMKCLIYMSLTHGLTVCQRLFDFMPRFSLVSGQCVAWCVSLPSLYFKVSERAEMKCLIYMSLTQSLTVCQRVILVALLMYANAIGVMDYISVFK